MKFVVASGSSSEDPMTAKKIMPTKVHTTNYQNTFIQVAVDCVAPVGTEPPAAKRTVARLQYEMLNDHPYVFTSDDVIFGVFADRHSIAAADRAAARAAFFAKGQPCLRTSPLSKSYGWGVHADGDGKVALYSNNTTAYDALAAGKAPDGSVVALTRAMRS